MHEQYANNPLSDGVTSLRVRPAPDVEATAKDSSMKLATGVRLAIGAVLVVAAVLSLVFLPVRDYVVAFLDWVRSLGPRGAVVLAFAYIPACLFFIPGSLLTLGGGFAFGVVAGTVAVSAGSVAGATVAFLTGRTLARDLIAQRVARSQRFAAIDRAVADSGFRIVFLTRLSPVFPFNLLNYAYGLTQVRLRDYVLASWIGMLPGTVMYVYLGSAVKNLADLAAGRIEHNTGQTVFFFVGLVATVLITVAVTRIAKKALNESVGVTGSDSPDAANAEDASSSTADTAAEGASCDAS